MTDRSIDGTDIFLKWCNELSNELGFEEVTDLIIENSQPDEFYDKIYILELFFEEFTYKAIVDEINKYLRNKRTCPKLYYNIREYVISVYGDTMELSNIFEYDDSDEDYIQLKEEGAHLLLKSMGYIY